MGRTIIQISPHPKYDSIVALCDDGTVWTLSSTDAHWEIVVPTIPQDKNKDICPNCSSGAYSYGSGCFKCGAKF
jgi:hypothetical protein